MLYRRPRMWARHKFHEKAELQAIEIARLTATIAAFS